MLAWYEGPEGSGAPCARFGHSANLINQTKMVVFGGGNGTDFFNDLYVLDLDAFAWTQPKTTGPAPSPRFNHISAQNGNKIIIHGGYCFDDDLQKQAGEKQGTFLRSCYLNDLRVLNTDKFEWIRVRVSGAPPLPRYGHSACISGSDIIVFGGWTYESGSKKAYYKESTSPIHLLDGTGKHWKMRNQLSTLRF